MLTATPNAKSNDPIRGSISPHTSRQSYHKNNGSIADILHYSVNDPKDNYKPIDAKLIFAATKSS